MDDFAELAKRANEMILESIAEGVFTVDRDWRIMSFNRGSRRNYRYSATQN